MGSAISQPPALQCPCWRNAIMDAVPSDPPATRTPGQVQIFLPFNSYTSDIVVLCLSGMVMCSAETPSQAKADTLTFARHAMCEPHHDIESA